MGSFTDTYNDSYMRVLNRVNRQSSKKVLCFYRQPSNLTISVDLPGLLAPEESLNCQKKTVVLSSGEGAV